MKKIFFFATMLLSIAATAQQRTFVKSVSTNYAAKQVTFNISWAAGSRGMVGANTYNSKVWVLIDYQEVQNGMAIGSWKRANVVLSSLPAGCTADGTNTKGFWYQGQPSAAQNANITVTLSGVPAQFNWCAFASDCPPQAIYSNESYTLKGTPPFTLTTSNGTTVTGSKIYAGCITAITDATHCPGSAQPCCGSVDANVGDDGCCLSELTLCGGYCRNLAADGADCWYGMERKLPGAVPLAQVACPSGWRLANNGDFSGWVSKGYEWPYGTGACFWDGVSSCQVCPVSNSYMWTVCQSTAHYATFAHGCSCSGVQNYLCIR